MKNLQTIKQLIEPSVFSGTTSVLLSLGVLVVFGINSNAKTGFLFEKILGDNYVSQLQSINQASALLDTEVFGSRGLNELLFFLFWMAVGLMVFYIVSFISSGVGTFSENLMLTKKHDATSTGILKANLTAFVFSAIFLGMGIVYGIFFMNLLFPFSLMSAQIGLSSLPHPLSFLWLTLSLIILSLSFQIVAVFIRLITRRKRVWGLSDDTYAAHHSFNR